jgi:ribosomal protein S18 acetylase RimI-like enzyme
VATSGEKTLRFSGGWARVSPWRGHSEIAHLILGTDAPVSRDGVDDCVARLQSHGYEAVVTSAVNVADSLPFVDAGFDVRERLHLLEHTLRTLPDAHEPARSLRRARRSDRAAVVDLDQRAFDTFWRLDETGLREALRATPSVRFRVGQHSAGVAGYSITGRAGTQGYLQRIAVDPDVRRQGWGRALVVDALRWLVRHDASRALVNTQLDNDAAMALYESCGFRQLPTGLCVLGRAL